VRVRELHRKTKVALASLAVVVMLAFFLAPISYWFSQHGPLNGSNQTIVAYRSLGCLLLGIGDSYYTAGDGLPAMFEFTCRTIVYP